MKPWIAGAVGVGLATAVAAGVWGMAGNAVGGNTAGVAAPAAAVAATPTPQFQTSQLAAERYLKAWAEGRFADMHALFTPEAQATTPLAPFVQRMQDIHAEATIQRVSGTVGDYAARPTSDDPRGLTHQQVKVTLQVSTTAVGDFPEELTIVTAKDQAGDWKIAWTPDALFRDLAGDRLVRLMTEKPRRGAIVDRSGAPLANEGGLVTVGVVPGWLENQDQAAQMLAQTLDLKPEAIKRQIAAAQPDWYVPLKDLPGPRKAELAERFGAVAGVVLRDKGIRSYPGGGLAANVVGYVSPVSADDLKTLAAKGYTETDLIGRAGIEAWGEEKLAGTIGARLTIISRDGQLVRTIKEQAGQQGRNIALALDANVQRIAEEALGDRTGSIVVMDPRDNTVLALASGPRFDPNGFIRGWSGSEWQQLNNDPRHPFLNRPAVSAYPAGSVFKVVTMAAGLERGGFTPATPFNCNGRWTGLPGSVFNDWLPQGHGALDLSTGLAQSCDIVFYEVSRKLDGLDPKILPQFARGFGLGAPTGVLGVAEAGGIVPDADWKRQTVNQSWFTGDSVNLGIGQGYLEATPLQIANAYAAIARGGSLKKPLLVWRELDSRGATLQEYAAEDRGPLPVTAANLAAIRAALKRVAGAPEGTAYTAFRGFPTPVAAKSGTAENQDLKNTHAWFVAYAPADEPRVLVTVMLERGGMGSADAAPVARRVLEATVKWSPALRRRVP